MSNPLRLAVVGTGLKAIDYARAWLGMADVSLVAVADVDAAARDRFAALCVEAGRARPDVFADIGSLLDGTRGKIDAVYLSTPHAFHAEGALAIIRAGVDLLLEKPMVTTVAEAQQVIVAQRESGTTVVVAFQGALSPLVADTRSRVDSGAFGELVSIAGTIWEDWADRYAGQWKQRPEISGGGFMFDTGAHMMNTVCLLAGSEFERVAAFMNDRGRPVDIATVVAARLENGALVTLNAAGEGPAQCASQITLFFTKAIVRIDAWGAWREISVSRDISEREEADITENPLLTFVNVCEGRLPNPSPVENGLRFARLWDAIKESASRNGEPVPVDGAST